MWILHQHRFVISADCRNPKLQYIEQPIVELTYSRPLLQKEVSYYHIKKPRKYILGTRVPIYEEVELY